MNSRQAVAAIVGMVFVVGILGWPFVFPAPGQDIMHVSSGFDVIISGRYVSLLQLGMRALGVVVATGLIVFALCSPDETRV